MSGQNPNSEDIDGAQAFERAASTRFDRQAESRLKDAEMRLLQWRNQKESVFINPSVPHPPPKPKSK
jgi:hypothetical protein